MSKSLFSFWSVHKQGSPYLRPKHEVDDRLHLWYDRSFSSFVFLFSGAFIGADDGVSQFIPLNVSPWWRICLPEDVREQRSCPFSTTKPRLRALQLLSNADKQLSLSHVEHFHHWEEVGSTSLVYRRLVVRMRPFYWFYLCKCYFSCLNLYSTSMEVDPL